MEDVLFKNITKYDKTSLLKFQNKVMLKWIILCAFIIISICLPVGISLILFLNEYVGGSIIIIGFLGAFVFLPCFIKDTLKKLHMFKAGEKFVNSYEFFQEKLTINSSISNTKKLNLNDKKTNIYYNDIYKITISNLYINFFISPSESLILDKRGMTKGTADDLIDLLSIYDFKIKYYKF